MSAEPPSGVHRRSDIVLRAGIAITILGIIFTLVAIIPLFVPSVSMPSALWACSMLIGVGLVVVFVGLALGSRSRRRTTGRAR